MSSSLLCLSLCEFVGVAGGGGGGGGDGIVLVRVNFFTITIIR